jgi:ATP-dependent helicase/nuclease subunit A
VPFEGVIDADYGDWIVDYKTDRQVHPEHHAPQLALYLRATGAARASLDYLRHDLLYTLSADELAQGLSVAQMFGATPSAEACRFCLHRGVCDQAALVTTGDVGNR